MGNLLDKIMVVEGESVELSPEIRDRMKKAFDEAVNREMDEHFCDGIQIVLDTMVKMDLDSTRKLVEERLINDGILELDDAENEGAEDEGKQNVDEGLSFAEIVAGQIG